MFHRSKRSDTGKTHFVHDEVRRFWLKVYKNEITGCWMWQAHTLNGYGLFTLSNQGGTVRAYRYAYELSFGKIPDGLEIHHKCGKRSCVNPDHLEAVTREEHPGQIMMANKRKTHCIHGHEYTPENTIICNKGKSRHCRICRDRVNHGWRGLPK
jgi:hypothetical protein